MPRPPLKDTLGMRSELAIVTFEPKMLRCLLGTLLVCLCSPLHAQDCNYKDACFEYDFRTCDLDVTANVTEDGTYVWQQFSCPGILMHVLFQLSSVLHFYSPPDLVKLTMLSSEIYGSDYSLFYSSLLPLFCSKNQPAETDMTGPPYCIVEWSVNDLTEDEGTCKTCNWYVVCVCSTLC